jgi:hypothetical protein
MMADGKAGESDPTMVFWLVFLKAGWMAVYLAQPKAQLTVDMWVA